jgi:MFS family permease
MIALIALYAFEALAVATAMPTVARELDGLSLYALAFAGTLASSVIGLVVAGRTADLRGPGVVLRQGIAWFAAGLVIAGLASHMWSLVLGRVVQGYGGGLMSVSIYVVVGRVYAPVVRARLFAAFAAAWVLPAVIGPVLSGLIVEHAGWRWVFLSVPLLAGAAATLVLPALRGIGSLPDVASAGRGWRRIGWAAGAAVGVLLLHVAGQRHDRDIVPWLVAIAAVLLVCALRLLPPGTLRARRGLPTVILIRGIACSAFFGTEVFVPLLLSRERGLSPALAGAVLTLGALGWSFGSWCRGRMRNPDPVKVLRSGLGLIAAGVAGVAVAVMPSLPVALVMGGWAMAGLGMGLLFPTLSVLTLELSAPAEQGANASALQLAEALFTATLLALGGSLFAALRMHHPSAAYVAGFSISIALALAGAWLASRAGSVAPGKTVATTIGQDRESQAGTGP